MYSQYFCLSMCHLYSNTPLRVPPPPTTWAASHFCLPAPVHQTHPHPLPALLFLPWPPADTRPSNGTPPTRLTTPPHFGVTPSPTHTHTHTHSWPASHLVCQHQCIKHTPIPCLHTLSCLGPLPIPCQPRCDMSHSREVDNPPTYVCVFWGVCVKNLIPCQPRCDMSHSRGVCPPPYYTTCHILAGEVWDP
jgi:hypothetical protein